jgi:hypothetical protein
MSTLTEDGISAVKQVACDRLLSSRVEVKLKVCARDDAERVRCMCADAYTASHSPNPSFCPLAAATHTP